MKRTVLFVSAGLLAVFSLQAGVVLTENFDGYPDGPVVGAANSPWLSHSGTGGTLLVAGKQLRVTGGSSEDANAPLGGAPYTTNWPGSLYSSFTIKLTALPGAAGTYFAHFKDTNSGAATGFGGRVWVGATNMIASTALPAGKFRIGIGNGTSASASSGQIDQDLDTNVTYTIVTRFTPSIGTATIWLNPNSEADPGVTATDPGTQSRPNPIDVVAYAFRQASGEGTILVDDLAVGSQFNDVAGTNRPPSLSTISPQSTPANTPTPAIPFGVQDPETPAASLILSAGSSNPTLVPTNNIVISAGSTDRTVTVTPANGQQGFATIFIIATDGVNTNAVTFQLTVGAPAISTIENQRTLTNTVLSGVPFTVSDTESPAASLSVTPVSSNPTLIPNANLNVAGSEANRSLTITPAAGQAGLATITLWVSDGTTSNSTSFIVTVNRLLGVQLNEPFAYPDGTTLYLGTGSSWVHHSGNFGELVVTNGEVELSGGLSEDMNTNLLSQPFNIGDGTVLYSSFTVRYLTLPSQGGDYFAHFKDSSSGFRARVFAATTNAAIGKYRLGVANQGGAPSVLFPLDLDTQANYTVVTRYDVGTGISTLWVNPSNESSACVTATDTPNPTAITAYALRQSGGIGTNRLDNLKVGTAMSDVITIVNQPTTPSISAAVLVGGNIQIDFSADAADTPGQFTLVGSADVSAAPGSYANVTGQNITALGNGVFRATAPVTGGVQFYRIRR